MKTILNMRVVESSRLNDTYALIKFEPTVGTMPAGIEPGQFVQVEIADSKTTFLRRPISINMVDESGRLWLLVRNAGAGTAHLTACESGQIVNMILPLGHGFSRPARKDGRILLVGGGVGVAPLLYAGKMLAGEGYKPEFVLGAKSKDDVLEYDEFCKYGPVHVTTEDGSMGVRGFATMHPIFDSDISHIACCGPTPMMRAVADIARSRGIYCEVSLENMMACGLGACLCCVEDTADKGNVCVCTEGPVFNINRLK